MFDGRSGGSPASFLQMTLRCPPPLLLTTAQQVVAALPGCYDFFRGAVGKVVSPPGTPFCSGVVIVRGWSGQSSSTLYVGGIEW